MKRQYKYQPPHVYKKAAAILERDGWCRGTYESVGGQRCVMGSLLDAGKNGCCFPVMVLNYNDAPERTFDDILMLLAMGHAGVFEDM